MMPEDTKISLGRNINYFRALLKEYPPIEGAEIPDITSVARVRFSPEETQNILDAWQCLQDNGFYSSFLDPNRSDKLQNALDACVMAESGLGVAGFTERQQSAVVGNIVVTVELTSPEIERARSLAKEETEKEIKAKIAEEVRQAEIELQRATELALHNQSPVNIQAFSLAQGRHQLLQTDAYFQKVWEDQGESRFQEKFAAQQEKLLQKKRLHLEREAQDREKVRLEQTVRRRLPLVKKKTNPFSNDGVRIGLGGGAACRSWPIGVRFFGEIDAVIPLGSNVNFRVGLQGGYDYSSFNKNPKLNSEVPPNNDLVEGTTYFDGSETATDLGTKSPFIGLKVGFDIGVENKWTPYVMVSLNRYTLREDTTSHYATYLGSEEVTEEVNHSYGWECLICPPCCIAADALDGNLDGYITTTSTWTEYNFSYEDKEEHINKSKIGIDLEFMPASFRFGLFQINMGLGFVYNPLFESFFEEGDEGYALLNKGKGIIFNPFQASLGIVW